jgi:hypothetical protein
MTDFGDRTPSVDTTLDALSGGEVPFRNVLAELAEEFGLEYGGESDAGEDVR